jgi:hypothetical protein
MYDTIKTELEALETQKVQAIERIEQSLSESLTALQKTEFEKVPFDEGRTVLRCIAEMLVEKKNSQRYTMDQDFFAIFQETEVIQNLNKRFENIFSLVLKDPSPSGDRPLRININFDFKFKKVNLQESPQ